MCHVPRSRSFYTARVAASVAATFSLFIFSDGFRVGSYHLVGRQQRSFFCPRSLAPACNRWSSSVATMFAQGGEVAPETHAKPSVGAEVALTRETGKNAKLASLLEEAGVSSVEIPCIRHQDGPDLTLLPTALEDKDLAYVVITSPEAAKVFLTGWNQAGQPTVPVACIGKATSEVLERSGITPVFTPTKATGETLAAELPFPEAATGAERGHLVLYPASSRAQKTVESGLTARGFNVRRLNTYDTVPAEWDSGVETAAKAASVVAFGSPSAVKTWARKMGVESGMNQQGTGDAVAACIGEISARACREAGWADSAIFYPEKPGMEGWARAVLDALEVVKASSREAVA